MAEALLRTHSSDQVRAFSEGLEPKAEVFPPVALVMREIGVDISQRKPKGEDRFLGRVHFERVIVVRGDAEEKCPSIFGPARRIYWPTEYPASAAGSKEEILAVCRKVRDRLNQRILAWLTEEGIPILS